MTLPHPRHEHSREQRLAQNLPARLTLIERISEERWLRLEATLARLEEAILRLDRRLWLAASALASAGAATAISLLWQHLLP
ncbi:MAG: hypothetical protein MRY63_06480 [Neomegalonema sp.]|nr:hypothetical protein [Neomegalonema sp.]